ncbi:hypothetical protein H206_00011 [Candidatus Electrothrix aarhusensis]|uniref:Uncharacterized protein n=1 Tax=Candidatus Electrothrix aarhusensis TaxID=1859131 RepID=A0A3S3UAQ7_9BACT|nr:hypothetical protein H206_00011 [Candidatus Electrothrix aarhusensis]
MNKGSKAMMMGLGKKRRDLPREFSGSLPPDCAHPNPFLPGTLVVQGDTYENSPELGPKLAAWEGVADWPVILLVDSTAEATESMQEFIWTFFTRFEPAADIHGKEQQVKRFHVGLTPPIVFDCRLKLGTLRCWRWISRPRNLWTVNTIQLFRRSLDNDR